MSSVDIAVLVVSYHGARDVERLAYQLAARSAGLAAVMSVVDNSLSEHEAERLHALVGCLSDRIEIRVSVSSTNLGYARGNAVAARAVADLDPEVTLIMNPDAEIVEGSLSAIVASVRQAPTALHYAAMRAETGPSTGLAAMSPWTGRHIALTTNGRVPKPGWIVYPRGHFLAARTSSWSAWGGLDPDYFLYGEEPDLVLRAGLFGERLRAIPGVVVAHRGGGSTRANASTKSLTEYRYGTASRIRLFRKHRRLRRGLVILVLVRAAYAAILLAQCNPSAARAVLLGIRDGSRPGGSRVSMSRCKKQTRGPVTP